MVSGSERSRRGRAVLIALVAALTAYVSFAMLWGFDWFPGLHGDEAWVGLRALENESRGFFTLRGMNYYSGAIHPYIVSLAFRAVGPSVVALRAVGLAWNLLAVTILVVHLARRFGLRSALTFLLLLAGSVLLLFEARLAWEVCAWNALLCAVLLVSSHALLDERSTSGRLRLPLFAFLFFSGGIVGLLNHYAFGCVSLAFLAAAVLLALVSAGPTQSRFLLANLINAVGLVAVYRGREAFADEARFGRDKTMVLAGIALLPVTELAIFLVADRGMAFVRARGWIARVMGGDGLRRRLVEAARAALLGCVLVATLAGLAAFWAIHGDGFVGALSGTKVTMRLFSWIQPLPLQVAGWIFVAAVMVAYAITTMTALRTCARREIPASSVLPVLLPPFYAAALAGSTDVSSLRHFGPVLLLLFVALAIRAPAIRSRRRLVAAWIAAGAFAVMTQSAAWATMGGAANRAPVRFRLGATTETSAHFVPTRPVYESLKARGICRYAGEPGDAWFVAYPLYFYKALDGYACDNPTTVWMSYYHDGLEPPGFEVHVRGR